MYIHFNNNPLGRKTADDCSIRAVDIVLSPLFVVTIL